VPDPIQTVVVDQPPPQQPPVIPGATTTAQQGQQRVYTADEVEALKERLVQEFTGKLHKVTGGKSLEAWEKDRLEKQGEYQKLAEQYSTEAAQLRQQLQQTIARAEILRAATEALEPEVVYVLLKEKVVVSDDGQVKVDGKPVAAAVKALLTEKQYLARPAGGSGSGAPVTQKPDGDKHRTLEWYNRANPTDRMKFFKEGGTLITAPTN